MLNCVVSVCVKLVNRARSSSWIVPGGGVVSRGAPEAAGGEVKGGMIVGGGIGRGEEVASPSWECADEEEDSREVSAGSGEETRVGSAERRGGNWEGWEGGAEGVSVSAGGKEVRAIWSEC